MFLFDQSSSRPIQVDNAVAPLSNCAPEVHLGNDSPEQDFMENTGRHFLTLWGLYAKKNMSSVID